MGQVKWPTTNHTKGWSSPKEDVVLYMAALERSHILWAPSRKSNNSNKYCSQLDNWKHCSKKNHLELVNRKSIRIIQDHMFLWRPGKNCHSLVGKFWFILHIHQTLHLQISIYLSHYKIFLMEKISISWKTIKGTWNSFLLKMTTVLEDGIMKLSEILQKVVEQNGEHVL